MSGNNQVILAGALRSSVASFIDITIDEVGIRTAGCRFYSTGSRARMSNSTNTANPPRAEGADTAVGNWLLVGPASDFEIQFINQTSNADHTVDTAGGSQALSVWTNLGTTRAFWVDSAGASGNQTSTYTISIRRASTSVIESSGTLSITMRN